MSTLNILVFCPYYPPHTGGLETHSDEFNNYLAEKGVSVVVFTPNIPYSTQSDELRSNGVRIIRYPALEIIPNYPVPKFWHPQFWKLFSFLFHSHFDIVISRTRFFLSSLLALLYAKIRGIKWIHIEHGSDFVKLSSSFKTAVAKLYDFTFGKLIFRCSDLNISISRAVQKFVTLFDTRNSPIIYRGIDFESIDANESDISLQKKYPGKIILATAARLYKWKGIENTVSSIRELPEEIQSKIIFLIIGDGEDYQRLQTLARGFPIELLGNIQRKDVISILKAADIYIHSSLPGGGLSTSLLEAMYCKCAVIATKNEGADEVITHQKNGILLSNANSQEIEKAIQILFKNPSLRTKYAEESHLYIKKEFSWEISIKKYLAILQSLVHE